VIACVAQGLVGQKFLVYIFRQQMLLFALLGFVLMPLCPDTPKTETERAEEN
jgi:hypothetical protein